MASRVSQGRMVYWRISNCKQLARCSILANLVFTWGIPNTDNVGRLEGDPELIKGNLFPYHKGVTPSAIKDALKELHNENLIIWYKVGENWYIQYPNFDKFQMLRRDRAYKSDYPDPEAVDIDHQDCSRPILCEEEEKEIEEEAKVTTKLPYKEIIQYLNLIAGTSYKYAAKETQECIRARLNEKFTVDDFKAVIDKKVAEWNHPPGTDGKDTRAWIRPKTLFGTKFESYLNQKTGGTPKTNQPGNMSNFEQRQYDDEHFDKFFNNK